MLGTASREMEALRAENEELRHGRDRIRAVLDSLPYVAPELLDRKYDELVTVCRQVVGKRSHE